MKTSQKIQLYKTITWAVVSFIITSLIGWWFSGDIMVGAAIGVVDRIIKMGIYYAHERWWHKKYKEEKQLLWENQLK